jgi:DNA (cytosine-5)-methyltransferase 1
MILEGIDLFCGAGGTTTGVHRSRLDGQPIAKVVACINHDAKAIESHKTNHPEAIHFIEDIRHFNTKYLPKKNPEAFSFIWASLECTNFSNAKGGLPRDADSRTLADHLFRYVADYDPDYIMIENVREFMAWGPLDENGKPISRLKGEDYTRWVAQIKSYGYSYQHRLLNSADFGAYTSRLRYFGAFAKHGLPIVWPQPTHSKKAVGHLKKWKAVRDVLDLEIKGESIFTRKKPLAENTLKRIYAGLVKYVANGDDSFIKKYFSGRPQDMISSLDNPSGTIKTKDSHALVKAEFLVQQKGGNPKEKSYPIERPSRTVTTAYHDQLVQTEFLQSYYSGNDEQRNHSLEDPANTVTTNNRFAIVQTEFFAQYYGNSQCQSVNDACPTLTTKDRLALVNMEWLDKQFSNEHNHQSIEVPSGSLTVVPKMNLVSTEFLMNPQFKNNGKDLDSPCFTLIARMDKKPPYLVSAESGQGYILLSDADSETMSKIKIFMAVHGIVDIKMRMLMIPELLRIQGFGDDYKLAGTQTNQKKFIGNAVVPMVPKVWFEALAQSLMALQKSNLKTA